MVSLPLFSTGPSIPRVIHQIHLQGWSDVRPEIRASVEALRRENPDWEHRFYDDAQATRFIRAVYGEEVLSLYSRLEPAYHAAKSDLLRYLVCYCAGGVYLDMKSTAVVPLDQVLKYDDIYLLAQWPSLRDRPAKQLELAHVHGGEFLQWFIVTAPGHPFLRAVLEGVLHNIQTYRPFTHGVGRDAVLRLTGPIAYTLAIHPLRESIVHRYVQSDEDLHFVYSIYGDHKTHRDRQTRHYSRLTIPVVRSSLLSTIASRLWFGLVLPPFHRTLRRFGLLPASWARR